MTKRSDWWDRLIGRGGLFILGIVLAVNEFIVRDLRATSPEAGAPRWVVVLFIGAAVGIPAGAFVVDAAKWVAREKPDGP